MKWYKHFTSDRDSLTCKLLRSRFGATGYGVYTTLIELVAENVGDNPKTWGMVDARHTIETLATECSVEPGYLREFLKFADESKIFEKKGNCLYWPEIKSRLDNWTYDKARKHFQVTPKSLPSHFGKKEKEKEKEKKNGVLSFNSESKEITKRLREQAHSLIGKGI
jgi:hypothetical protein